MTGTTEILGFCVVFHAFSCGVATFFGGNACGGVHMVNGNGESGAVVVCVVRNHLGQHEFFAQFFTHGHADKPFAVGCHKVYVFCGGKFCRTNQIPFVFSVGVVSDQNHATLTQFFQCFFNGVICTHNVILLCLKSVFPKKIHGQCGFLGSGFCIFC